MSSLLVPAFPATSKAETISTDLLISEYVEGSSFNKALELYNGSGAALDLSDYTLELYANGATAATATLALAGTLASEDTYVLHHRDASAELKSKGQFENSSVINFNGDDAIVLKKSGVVVDSFGQVGARSNWGTDVTLVRNGAVTVGDSNPGDAFNRDAEWIVYPKDTFEYLGFHDMEGSPGNPEEPEEPADISSIEDARAMNLGETVTIKGIVAANLKNTISVQDATGGIAVRPTSLNATVGDEVTLTGTLADYRGLLQLDSATIVEKTGNVGAPSPKVVTGADVTEENESQLVSATKY